MLLCEPFTIASAVVVFNTQASYSSLSLTAVPKTKLNSIIMELFIA